LVTDFLELVFKTTPQEERELNNTALKLQQMQSILISEARQ